MTYPRFGSMREQLDVLLGGEVTTRQVARALGCSRVHASRMLRDMYADGLLEKFGSGAHTRYRRKEVAS